MPVHDYTLAELTSQSDRASRNVATACRNSESWVYRRIQYQQQLASANTIPLLLLAYQQDFHAGEKIKFWARKAMRASRGLERVEK
jgi:beta-lactamase class D